MRQQHLPRAGDPLPVDRAGELVQAVCAVDGVAGLHPGRFGEVALLYPRRRIPGLRLTTGPAPRLEVHVVADLGRRRPLPELAEAVRGAVDKHADGLPVDVVIADAAGGGTR